MRYVFAHWHLLPFPLCHSREYSRTGLAELLANMPLIFNELLTSTEWHTRYTQSVILFIGPSIKVKLKMHFYGVCCFQMPSGALQDFPEYERGQHLGGVSMCMS